ncbi:24464_t:CDS:2 [Dentiscutata erythropus]|uniref:24464_t:CDS:1 n=1 Tax=Dentiscutata erythropus TaxID=1348616 RepID=A0A9N9FQ51_9GLOM|nr:24464_t:CDS:2 [Dentiscutata erythropus]
MIIKKENLKEFGVSPLAPVIINVQDDEIVYQRILLVYGQAGPRDLTYHSNITVEHHADNFPSTTWPIFNSHFKCLVHLDPGPNNIRFTFDPESCSPGLSPLSTVITINYIPMLQNPPLHLAMLVAKDSKCVIDTPPEKVVSGDNNLDSAKAKFRCAAYLWQAFTAEQMYRNGFGRRVFRLEEEWQQDTLSNQESSLRQTAKIHIIRTQYTLEELLDPERAQQYNPPPGSPPTTKEDLYSIFMNALQEYGAPFDKQCYVAGLILDSHWDPEMKLIRGHAALGGGGGHIQLGIFGSHTTHAWPKFLEEVVSCFQDETQTDENILANDCQESGTWWRCCNIGIGAMLHEVGHALTCPHSASGIMMRGFNNLNRTFTVKEPNNTHPITPSDERCDVIRFRYHPCFRIPSDPRRSIAYKDVSPDFWPLDDSFLISCSSGISLVEIHLNENYVYHLEYLDERIHEDDIELSLEDIMNRVGWKHGDELTLNVIGKNQTENTLHNAHAFLDNSHIVVPIHGKVLKSARLGRDQGKEFQAIFNKPQSSFQKSPSSSIYSFSPKKPYLSQIIIKAGLFIDSITFIWSDNTVIEIGGDGGGEHEFTLDEDEKIIGLNVRAGFYIDGIEIKTNRRSSGWIGGSGGSMHFLHVPKDHEMIGIYGSGDTYINSLGIIYKKS